LEVESTKPKTLTDQFEESWKKDSKRNAATTIRNEVKEWTGDKAPIAARRWIWEIIQNAVDVAIEKRRDSLQLQITLSDGNMVVKHDGGPFKLKEIIAIVSGGSSKTPLPVRLTGQFGKGFLVTHVVSKDVIVEGFVDRSDIESMSNSNPPFRFTLKRSSSKVEDIEANIKECADELSRVIKDTQIEQDWTRFTFLKPDPAALKEGLSQLSKTIPFVLLFNPVLEKVTVDQGGQVQTWVRGRSELSRTESGVIVDRVPMTAPEGSMSTIRVSNGLLDVAVQLESPTGRLIDCRGVPTLFLNFPLYDSNLGTCYAVNSPRFNVDPNRGFVERSADNMEILTALPGLVSALSDILVSEKAANIGKIAHFDMKGLTPERADYLRLCAKRIPQVLADLRIVECNAGSDTPRKSVFPTGRYLGKDVEGLTDLVHALLVRGFQSAPIDYLDWELIARGWEELGFTDLKNYSLQGIISILPLLTSKLQPQDQPAFIGKTIRALFHAHNATHSLPSDIASQKVLLNQSLSLVEPQLASVDNSIPDDLKAIAAELGWNIRDQLIHSQLLEDEETEKFIETRLCPGRPKLGSKEVVTDLWKTYVYKWKENQKQPVYRDGLQRFAVWIALNLGDSAKEILDPEYLPLLCADNQFRGCIDRQDYPFLWPKAKWSEPLKKYGQIFYDSGILSVNYITSRPEEEQDRLLSAFHSLQVAYGNPMLTWAEKSLKLEEATAVGEQGEFRIAVDVKECSDIIGLQDMTSAVVGGKDPSKAAAVLEFVFNFVLENDTSWTAPVALDQGRSLYPSYWLAVLKTKDWVPSADGKHSEPLNEENIERVLLHISPLTLSNNVETFLTKHFNQSSSSLLALRLRQVEPSDQRMEVIGGLLSLSPEQSKGVVEKMRKHLENAKDWQINNTLGKTIEKVVSKAFEEMGFRTRWTGIGSDFAVVGLLDQVGELLVFDPAKSGSEILIEVKATTSNGVRMSLAQAEESVNSKARFLPCVADLRGSTVRDELQDGADPKAELKDRIIQSLKFSTELWKKVETAVSEAKGLEGHQTNLKNFETEPGVRLNFEEGSIRVGVSDEVWGSGLSFQDGLTYCKDHLSGITNSDSGSST